MLKRSMSELHYYENTPLIVEFARIVLKDFGWIEQAWVSSGGCRSDRRYVYEDEQVRIEQDVGLQSLDIVRLENNNPIIMVDPDGKIFRSHGERRYVADHIKALALGEETAVNEQPYVLDCEFMNVPPNDDLRKAE